MERILSIRKYHALTLADLKKLNVRLGNAKPYLIAVDHTGGVALPSFTQEAAQLDLFAPFSALTGSL